MKFKTVLKRHCSPPSISAQCSAAVPIYPACLPCPARSRPAAPAVPGRSGRAPAASAAAGHRRGALPHAPGGSPLSPVGKQGCAPAPPCGTGGPAGAPGQGAAGRRERPGAAGSPQHTGAVRTASSCANGCNKRGQPDAATRARAVRAMTPAGCVTRAVGLSARQTCQVTERAAGSTTRPDLAALLTVHAGREKG